MNARRQKLKPDEQGRYRPRIGWYAEYLTKTQPRFNLGTDKREAEIRYARILKLYEEDCSAHNQNEWSSRGLEYARLLASGQTTIRYAPDRDDDRYDDVLAEYRARIEVDRKRFPSLDIQPADETEYQESSQRAKEFVAASLRELQDEMRFICALPQQEQLPDKLIAGTLHEALDAYAEVIRREGDRLDSGELKPWPVKRLERVERFKREHADMSLTSLNYDTCSGLVAHWRNRPVTSYQTRSSRDNSRLHLGELFRFFRWLDTTNLYEWVMPRGVPALSRKIVKLDGETKLSALTKNTYTPAQLAFLNKHASPLERTILYLGLNCAMGAAELGRLEIDDFKLRARHPCAEKLGFESTDEDTFARYLRPKTEVFGEWLLWPETVPMVEWAIARAKHVGATVLFVRENGAMMYKEKSKNPNTHSRTSGTVFSTGFSSPTPSSPVYRLAHSETHCPRFCAGTTATNWPRWS